MIPTGFGLCRYIALQNIVAGIQKTGIPFVKYDGTRFIPLAFDEDLGLFVIIPKMVLSFGLSIDQAIIYFNDLTSLVTAALSMVGFFLVFKTPMTRIVAILSVLYATHVSCMTYDIYRFPAALTVAFVPWALYFFSKKSDASWSTWLFVFSSGFLFGVSHCLRAYSFLPALCFAVPLVLRSSHATRLQKVSYAALMGLGFLLPALYLRHSIMSYQEFAKKTFPQYSWDTIHPHPFWHTAYWGLGYIQNAYGFKTEDKTSLDKVRSLNPSLFLAEPPPGFPEVQYDDRYEGTLRSAFFDFVWRHPHYVLENYFAKLGTSMVYILRYAHVGLIAYALVGLPFDITFAFVLAGGCALLPGLIALPSVAAYMLTLIVLCILFAALSINQLLLSQDKIRFKRFFSWNRSTQTPSS